MNKHSDFSEATLGGGCFWCLEAVFSKIRGVQAISPGYAGGHIVDPTYKQVCSGTTGHAEVVHFTFSENLLSFSLRDSYLLTSFLFFFPIA